MKTINNIPLFLVTFGLLTLGCTKSIDYDKKEDPKDTGYLFLPIVKMKLDCKGLFAEVFKADKNEIEVKETADGICELEKNLPIDDIDLNNNEGLKFINSTNFGVAYEYENTGINIPAGAEVTKTLDEQPIDYEFSLVQTQNNFLTRIEFKKGTARIEIDNSSNADLKLEMVLYSFKKISDDSPFQGEIDVSQKSKGHIADISLEEYYLDLTDSEVPLGTARKDIEDAGNYNKFSGNLTPTITVKAGQNLDYLDFDFKIFFEDREIKGVQGILNDPNALATPKTIVVEPTKFDGLDLGEIEDLTFEEVSLVLDYENGTGFEMDMEVDIEGYNTLEGDRTALVENDPNPTALNYPRELSDPKARGRIEFENLSPVIKNSKDRMMIKSKVTIKNDKVGFFNVDSLMKLSGKLNIPLHFKSPEFSYFETSLDIGDDNLDKAKELQLIFLVKNEIGLELSLGIKYTHHNKDKTISIVDKNLEEVEAISSQGSGKGTYEEYKIRLNEEEVKELKNSPKKFLKIGYKTPEKGAKMTTQGAFNLSLSIAVQVK